MEENNNVQKIHVNNVKKPVPFYSLDVIISVGYRVKSNRGVEFRRWANSVLKHYILQGYAINQKRIQQLGEVIRIMKRTEDELDSKQILSVIERHNNTLDLLDAYDHQTLKRPKGNQATYVLTYEECMSVIQKNVLEMNQICSVKKRMILILKTRERDWIKLGTISNQSFINWWRYV